MHHTACMGRCRVLAKRVQKNYFRPPSIPLKGNVYLCPMLRLAALLLCLLLPTLAGAQVGANFTLVLDAGHGGKDPGCVGSQRSNQEKDIALNIAMEVGRLVEQNLKGVNVVYTRKGDTFVELGRRAEIANQAKADLFVSIHVNAVPRRSGRRPVGVQSYTLSLEPSAVNLEVEKRENAVIALEGDGARRYDYSPSAEADILFELMQDRDMKQSILFAQMAQDEMVHTAGRNDMGVRQANLAVLRLTYMPSALLEVGFISSPAEETYLVSDKGQKQLAKAIYNAIARYREQTNSTQPR